MKKLCILDADDTLVESWTEILMPGVEKWMRSVSLLPAEQKPYIAIATNQGGVGLRYWMVKEKFGKPGEYPTESQARHLYMTLAGKIWVETGCDVKLFMCFAYQSKKTGLLGPVPDQHLFDDSGEWSIQWRKPNPGMLWAALDWATVDPKDAVMVGDSEDDREAAQRAGIEFCWAKDFFGQ